VVFEVRGDTQTITLSGQSQTTSIFGTVYGPSAAVNFSGGSGLLLDGLVAQSATLRGQNGTTVG
jgi:hypothetical protein